ncbi:MAG: hypothetical protein IPL84_07165 [Chitinophagaceae bacterium]|nr:hypothetical protein [Chitinophagaceae bacterium]
MKKRKSIFPFLCSCAALAIFVATPAATQAQSDSVFQFVKTIKGNFSYFNVDNLDNLYLVTDNNRLKKLNEKGDSVAVFNDVKKYGNPSYIDVTNPLKVLLYYKNYSTIVVLDRLITVRNIINLRKQNIFYVNAVTLSYDNYIWIFDEEDYKLKKIDEDGKLAHASIDWRMLFDSVPAPEKIIDRDNFVYLYDPEKGFYIFDYYGAFKNRLAFLNWTSVEVNGNTVYGFNNNILYSYELKSLQLKEYVLPAFFGKFSSIKAMNGKVYLLNDKGLDIYQIK